MPEEEVVETEEVEITEETDENDPSKLTAEDIKKMRAALKKANEEARDNRLELKRVKQEKESEEEKRVREAVENATGETEKKFKSRLVNAEAKSLLKDAGLSAAPERFLKMLDLESINLNDDGEIEGLSEQIEGLKADFPEVFKTEKRTVAPKNETGNRTPADTKPKTSAEKLAAQIGAI